MALGAQQRMLLVLSIDLDQRRADLAEALHGGEFAVDRDARASTALGDDPAHEQLATAAVAFARGEFRHCGFAFEFEQPLDDRFFLTGANHFGRRARAEQQSERAQDDRFAGAGFARQHVEAGAELEIGFLDDREVADVQFEQHRARLSPVEFVAPDFEIRMSGSDQRDHVAPAMNLDYVGRAELRRLLAVDGEGRIVIGRFDVNLDFVCSGSTTGRLLRVCGQIGASTIAPRVG